MSIPAPSQALGLYLHIPFCDKICHYCDFVKTAWHDPQDQNAYVLALKARIQMFLDITDRTSLKPWIFDSVFLGGGTPSVMAEAYLPLFEYLKPLIKPGAEISLEANPEHVNSANLLHWRELGINRLSLGVQSFQASGLRFLTRTHTPSVAASAIEQAREVINNVNVDLIYSWPEQTEDQWRSDIREALRYGARHLSLYSLTYEGRTPFARRVQRGVLDPMADEQQERLYHIAREELQKRTWVHEEVSNWAETGFETYHNAIYWTGGSYLGVGAGAHSYLAPWGRWGLRFHQATAWKSFLRENVQSAPLPVLDLLKTYAYEVEAERDAEAWIFETVSSGLRTQYGINVDAICAKTGYIWVPRPAIKEAVDRGLLLSFQEGWIRLLAEEWYRETSWALECALSFQKAHPKSM